MSPPVPHRAPGPPPRTPGHLVIDMGVLYHEPVTNHLLAAISAVLSSEHRTTGNRRGWHCRVVQDKFLEIVGHDVLPHEVSRVVGEIAASAGQSAPVGLQISVQLNTGTSLLSVDPAIFDALGELSLRSLAIKYSMSHKPATEDTDSQQHLNALERYLSRSRGLERLEFVTDSNAAGLVQHGVEPVMVALRNHGSSLRVLNLRLKPSWGAKWVHQSLRKMVAGLPLLQALWLSLQFTDDDEGIPPNSHWDVAAKEEELNHLVHTLSMSLPSFCRSLQDLTLQVQFTQHGATGLGRLVSRLPRLETVSIVHYRTTDADDGPRYDLFMPFFKMSRSFPAPLRRVSFSSESQPLAAADMPTIVVLLDHTPLQALHFNENPALHVSPDSSCLFDRFEQQLQRVRGNVTDIDRPHLRRNWAWTPDAAEKNNSRLRPVTERDRAVQTRQERLQRAAARVVVVSRLLLLQLQAADEARSATPRPLPSVTSTPTQSTHSSPTKTRTKSCLTARPMPQLPLDVLRLIIYFSACAEFPQEPAMLTRRGWDHLMAYGADRQTLEPLQQALPAPFESLQPKARLGATQERERWLQSLNVGRWSFVPPQQVVPVVLPIEGLSIQ